MAKEIISLAEARAIGYKRYFTGKPCKRGHVSERYTNSKHCIQCLKERNKSPAFRAYYKKYYRQYIDSQNEETRAYRSAVQRHKYRTKWRFNARHNSKLRKRRIKRATINCPLDQIKVQQLYLDAKRLRAETGKNYNVDHIIPIVHEVVCGLHCFANLRIVPYRANAAKGNTFNQDEYNKRINA